jgi:beta-phosphoglucomutase
MEEIQMKKIELFVFDLDGVLTETSHQHYNAWKQLADDLGIDIDLAFNETLKGVSRMDSLRKILVRGNKLDSYSFEQQELLATKKNEHYKTLIASFTREHLFDGVIELFEKLQKNNIKIALGSASKNGPTLLKAMDIMDYFDYVVNPAEVRGKPHPDIFLKACTELGVDPINAVGVEDAVNGVKAIKAANMYAIGIGDPTILHEADLIYESVKDIILSDIK